MAVRSPREVRLRPTSSIGSGRVRKLVLPESHISITQITTWCPDVIGPGSTNLYLIEDEALILLDAGIPTYMAKAFFYHWRNQAMPPEVEGLPPDQSERELLSGIELAGYCLNDIDLMVFSHGHLDHFMMAPIILDRSGSRVSAHVLDTPWICNPWALISMWMARQPQIAAAGMPIPAKSNERIREALEGGPTLQLVRFAVDVDSPVFWDGPLKLDGTAMDKVRVRHLPGHTPGSVGLLVGSEAEEKVLLSGDVLLFPITPHPDDLLVYLQTLRALGEYEDVGLVLPAHGKAIRDLKGRADFLKEHHKRRLKFTFDACRKPRSVWEVASMPNYFQTYVDRKEFNYLAGTEALVHMEILTMVGALHRTHIKDRVHYFRNSGEPFEEVYQRVLALVLDAALSPIMRY